MRIRSRERRRSLPWGPGRPEFLERRELMATLMWLGGSAEGSWREPENWRDASTNAPAAPTSEDDLVFVSNVNRTMYADLGTDPSRIPRSVTFKDSFDLAGGEIAVGAGGLTLDAGTQLSILSDTTASIVFGDGAPLKGDGDIVQRGTGGLVITGQNTTDFGGQVIAAAGSIRIGISSRLPQPKPKPGKPSPKTMVLSRDSSLLIGDSSRVIEFGSDGALQVDGSVSIVPGSRLSGGFVTGGGTISAGGVVGLGRFTVDSGNPDGTAYVGYGGTLAPGTEEQNGTLTVAGDLVFQATEEGPGTLTIRIDSAGASRLSVIDSDATDDVPKGEVMLSGASLVLVAAGAPPLNQSMTIVSAAKRVGFFDGLPEGAIVRAGGLPFRINYLSDSVTLTRVAMATTTTLTAPGTVNPLETATLTATVGGGVTGGTVTFQLDGKAIGSAEVVDGRAALVAPPLPLGAHSVRAVYGGGGSGSFLASESATSLILSAKATTTLAVSVPSTPPGLGRPATIRVTISGISRATGFVKFEDGPVVLGTALIFGNVSVFTTSRLRPGVRNLTVTYSGNANANSSRVSATVAVAPGTRPASDFNGDGKSDRAIYDPASGSFRVIRSGESPVTAIPIGPKGTGQSVPAVGDYDGDGISDAAVYMPARGQFGIRPSNGGADRLVAFGARGANQSIPIPADFDGDGVTDLAVYMPVQGRLAYRPSRGGGDVSFALGPAGAGKAIPVPADYDGDGRADVAVFVVSTATFLIRSSRTSADSARPFGAGGIGQTIPAPADHDGDGKADLAVYLPGLGAHAFRPSGGGKDVLRPFGARGAGLSLAAPGDYDGDGRADLAVYLTAIGAFGVRPSAGGADQLTSLGNRGRGASLPATAIPTVFSTTVRLLDARRRPRVAVS